MRKSLLLVLVLVAMSACRDAAEQLAEPIADRVEPQRAPSRYNREFVFVGGNAETPVVVPFDFQTVDGEGEMLDRGVRGWLARGDAWDRFVDETFETSRTGGVWRVVPGGDLTVLAGGSTEVETIAFEEGDRRLRLDVGRPTTGWNEAGSSRFRLLSGRLTVGPEALSGPLFEMLRADRNAEDGWPEGGDSDVLFLTAGDSIFVVIGTDSREESDSIYAWVRTSLGERNLSDVELRPGGLRPFEDARRDIPMRWSFRIPSLGIAGTVEAGGFNAVLGPERGGRRAVEIRYAVKGTMQLGDSRYDTLGMVRHIRQ